MSKRMQQPEVIFPTDKNSNELAFYHYGKHACCAKSFFGPSKRDYYLLHFVISGKGEYCVGDKRFTVEKNQGFLIRPNEETYYEADANDPWEYYFVAFHGTVASQIIDTVDWEDGYIIKPQNFQSVRALMKRICSIKKPDSGGEYIVLGNLYILLGALAKESSIKKTQMRTNEREEILNKAIDYIKRNYASGMKCVDIATAVNMHRASLYRLFKDMMNISIEKYLQNYRMDRAVYLLLNTEESTSEIATQVGMFDYPHFCRQFKKYYGFTPSEYRKKFVRK